MFHIELIGICGETLSQEQRKLIAACVLVAHSRRQEPLLEHLAVERRLVTPLAALFTAIEAGLTRGNVAVLASGDPLFFGIGRTLLKQFGAERLRVHPALSAVQLACARFKIPWDDLPLLSLHGRSTSSAEQVNNPDHPAARILAHQRVLCFTDQQHSPDALARGLLHILSSHGDTERLQGIRMRVAENLGLKDERLTEGSLAEMAAASFSPLNMVLIEQEQAAILPPALGLTEHEIRHSRGLITKDEIRAASLHRLHIPRQGVFWDIGGGSGSLSLEAARLAPELAIYTVEKKEEEQANIRHNIKTFGAYSIRLIAGEAPEALAQLPAPDRVFVGGSGKRLEEILHTAANRLAPGGRIVVNAVLASTRENACRILAALGLKVESSTLSLTRQAGNSAPQQFNPITIVTGSS
ncbi:MAG: precorrin-6y C5,15-methyltransferase (decarboxylating) subunit CbiE [Desulfobulbaceae bacterium]|nr:precorrin-6y C5,15-methyltransferase (decarboxylating) subunit CbiE [Desulfobulbaceae bacterium]